MPARWRPDSGIAAGESASAGAAAGPVFVVEMEADALRFPPGAVLATVQPIPRWANLLSRAAAVVAEHGSVAGHLANVAREFEVPVATTELEALLAEVDVVCVNSINACDAEHAVAAARAGRHVVVEKPLAVSLEEDRAIVEAFAEYGVATVHEAQGRKGLLAPHINPIYPGAHISGTAITVSVPPC